MHAHLHVCGLVPGLASQVIGILPHFKELFCFSYSGVGFAMHLGLIARCGGMAGTAVAPEAAAGAATAVGM
jgi:hypothetical protein